MGNVRNKTVECTHLYGIVATTVIVVFLVMMNIRSLRELRAIFGVFLAIIKWFLGDWLFNGIKYWFY